MPHWITTESNTISHKRSPARTGSVNKLACARREPLRQSRRKPLRGGAHFDPELRDFRRMHAVARHVAQMREARRDKARSCGSIHGSASAGDHARGEERKLKARIRERRRFPEQ